MRVRLARRAASATERTLVCFRRTMYISVLVPALRIKAYRAAVDGRSKPLIYWVESDTRRLPTGSPP